MFVWYQTSYWICDLREKNYDPQCETLDCSVSHCGTLLLMVSIPQLDQWPLQQHPELKNLMFDTGCHIRGHLFPVCSLQYEPVPWSTSRFLHHLATPTGYSLFWVLQTRTDSAWFWIRYKVLPKFIKRIWANLHVFVLWEQRDWRGRKPEALNQTRAKCSSTVPTR